MTTTHPTATSTALLVAGRAGHQELESLLRGMGFQTLLVDAEQMNTLRDPVSLCLIDLRENGEAIRIARAFRIAVPAVGRDWRRRSGDGPRPPPTRFAPACSTCCPGRRRHATSKR